MTPKTKHMSHDEHEGLSSCLTKVVPMVPMKSNKSMTHTTQHVYS
jgi:hypothetical protein